MSAKRRSGRQVMEVKYFSKEDTSEDEEEEDEELKNAKTKLKEMLAEDSEAESDFEAEIKKERGIVESTSEEDEENEEKEEGPDNDDRLKREAQMTNCIRGAMGKNSTNQINGKMKISNLEGGSRNKRKAGAGFGLIGSSFIGAASGGSTMEAAGGSASLMLSDSESSSDEEAKQNRRQTTLQTGAGSKIDFKTTSINATSKEEEGEEDDKQSSLTLLALAQNLDRMHSVWGHPGNDEKSLIKDDRIIPDDDMDMKDDTGESGRKGKRGRKGRKKESLAETNLDSITKLLAKGENVEHYSGEEEDEEEALDVSTREHVLPKEGIQINIELPDRARKKKKKGFDVAAFVKRELAKARRETQILLHQVHFIALVAHLRYLNLVLTDEMLYGAALSILPPAHLCSASDLTLTKLTATVRWLREFIPVNKTSFQEQRQVQPLKQRLHRVLETYLAMDLLELVTLFVLVCRALGLDTRITLNFDITPLKPPNEEAVKPRSETVTKPPSKPDPEAGKGACRPRRKKRNVSESEGDQVDFESNASNTKASKQAEKSKPSKEVTKEGRKSRKKRANASESEGDEESFEETKKSKAQSISSKLSRTSKRKSSETLSSKLSEASRRKAVKLSKPSCSKDREDDMIAKINKNYPTKKELEREEGPPSKASSRKRKSDVSSGENSKAKVTTGKATKTSGAVNYWAEVYLERDRKWISVDLETGRINAPAELESRLPKPIFYILGINNMGHMKDVTKRYSSNYMTSTSKIRFEEKWISSILAKFAQKKDEKEEREDLELLRQTEEAPMPTTVSGFKSHPLYVLQRHLLKFEAIYPADAPPLGWIKSEPVYARECVHTLQGRTSWLKEGRVVRIGELPYKVVKARPKWDRMTGSVIKDEPLEVFGHWQTELYVPPPAVDGKVPRNEYGNVELFKPWMLPKGCVHIPINGMSRVLRKLNIDAAPAMIGWDFSGSGCHPIYDGYVVCEEFADTVMDAWNQDQELKVERAAEKREKRALDNWRRIIKGIFIREKIQAKYMKNQE